MPNSNYPNGFPNGLTVRGLPIHQVHPGKVFYVNNSTVLMGQQKVGGSDGNKGTIQAPFATLDYAIGRCLANRGDIIMLAPNHAESIASATAINLDVAGVAIVGLGSGTKRPTFTYTTANTATMPVTADNITVKNIVCVGSFLSIAAAFTTGAAAWFTVEDCEVKDTSAILGILSIVKTTVSVNADHLHILNNRVHSIATTKAVAPIVVLGTMTGLTIKDNTFLNSVAQNNLSMMLSHAALVMTDAYIDGNSVYCVNTDTATGGVLITTAAITGSGMVSNNTVRALDTAAAIMITATAVQYGMYNNLYLGEGTSLSGFLLPAADTDA